MYTKRGIVDHIKENQAIIRLEDNQVITWDTRNLPSECALGSLIVLELKSKLVAEANKDELAQKILNEIFNPAQKAQQQSTG